MSRFAASVTLPDLFSISSIFQIVLDLGRVYVGILKWSIRSGNMKLLVAPLSMSANFGMECSGVEFDECMYGSLVWNEYGLRK